MRKPGSLNASKAGDEGYGSTINTMSKDISDSKQSYENGGAKEPVWKCRYVVTLVAFLVVFLASIHRATMGMIIVAMVNNTAISQYSKEKSESCLHLLTNSTEEDATLHGTKSEGEFIWSPETQGYILGSFFIGNIITLMPASTLAERYGCRSLIVGSLITSSILAILTPPFSWLSDSAVIAIQLLRGLVQGLPLCCIGILMANWSPKMERGFLYSITQTAHFLGPASGNIFAGIVSESPGGWPIFFYSIGGLGLLLAISILFFVSESPKEHTRISKAELNFILSEQENKLSRRRPKVPWRKLLTSGPVHAFNIAMIGRYWSMGQFWTVQSTFLGTILHYPIGKNGLFSAIPYFLAFLTSMVTTWISGFIEKRKIVSVDFWRKFLFLLSGLLYSSCCFGIYMAGCNRDLSNTFSILSLPLIAIGTNGLMSTMQDMSPTFVGTLYSLSCTIGAIASVVLPLVVGYLTDKRQTLEQWNKVFFIGIGVVMSTKIIFVVFASAKNQPWNFVDDENEKKEEKQSEIHKKDEMTRF